MDITVKAYKLIYVCSQALSGKRSRDGAQDNAQQLQEHAHKLPQEHIVSLQQSRQGRQKPDIGSLLVDTLWKCGKRGGQGGPGK